MSQHTLKIGQKVKIEPISEYKKQYYPWDGSQKWMTT